MRIKQWCLKTGSCFIPSLIFDTAPLDVWGGVVYQLLYFYCILLYFYCILLYFYYIFTIFLLVIYVNIFCSYIYILIVFHSIPVIAYAVRISRNERIAGANSVGDDRIFRNVMEGNGEWFISLKI